ncbi:MAG: Clp protease ClpP [Phocaeicola dorei]|nr:Clp protease ClpP [Phocaeicola dorei]
MDINSLQYVVGEAKADEVATIRFFGRITEESASRFNDEFDFLENVVRPSCIRVLINSEGGSVLFGMSSYSTIRNSKVDTECIIEGMAASMASILWAAGNRSLMRDYAILMIHNPMLPDDGDEKPSDMVLAFTKQIETIYKKRFGLKTEQIRTIMDGEAGKDGTFFDAAAAVKAGIIPAGNVLHTSKQLCEKVRNVLNEGTDIPRIEALMNRICAEAPALTAENKPFSTVAPTLNEKNNNPIMNEEKKISPEYGAVAAALGMKDQYEVKDVMSRITDLIGVEAKYKEVNKSLTDARTVIAGKDATIQNMQKDLDTVNVRLGEYERKEKEEQQARIKKLVADAREAGKITMESMAQWEEMAITNYNLVEKTLNNIPAREQISKEIATDPANVQAAKEASKTVEALMAEKVNEVVGDNFEFKKIQ